MSAGASARASKEGLARSGISGKEFLQRVIAFNLAAVQRGKNPDVQERCNVPNLRVAHGHSGHSLIGPSIADNRTNRVSVLVVIYGGGPDQVGSARTCRVI